MDIRLTRTQNMLRDAFEELLSEKLFEEITVSEICERSTVRRGTFYKHFQDKYDFFNFYLQSLTERFMEGMGAINGEDDLQTYTKNMHLELIRFVESHQGIAKHNMGQSMLAESLDMMVKQIAKGITLRAVKEANRMGRALPMPADFLGMFYAGGMMHSLRWWLAEGKPISAEELERYSTNFIMRYFEEG